MVISFDMDGTLVDGNFPLFIWQCLIPYLYSKDTGISLLESVNFVNAEYKKMGPERLEFFDIDYWFRYFRLPKSDFLAEKWPVTSYSDVLPSLRKLCDLDIALVVSSLSPRSLIEYELESLNIRKYFSRVFSATSDFGEVTKSIGFYLKVCSNLGVEPRELIHIGNDIRLDYLPPRELGIRSFLLARGVVKQIAGLECVPSLEDFARIWEN
jgi:FMN phosphatase YigB (HAD superfamily)